MRCLVIDFGSSFGASENIELGVTNAVAGGKCFCLSSVKRNQCQSRFCVNKCYIARHHACLEVQNSKPQAIIQKKLLEVLRYSLNSRNKIIELLSTSFTLFHRT